MNRVLLEVNMGQTLADFEIEVPDNCPICHASIAPIHLYSQTDDSLYNESHKYDISSVFACPSCHSLFYAKNKHNALSIDKYYELLCYGPNCPTKTLFNDEILRVSPSFVDIFNQSEIAEGHNLKEVAGVGYRKSLEFLIKDYACHIHPEQEVSIKDAFLKDCISKYIDHKKIRDLATVAAWLGNDETHYLRKWNDMDVQDLKRFIRSCVAWIQADIDAEDSAKIIASR